MRSIVIISLATLAMACAGGDIEKIRTADLEGALAALESNIAAIQNRDTEAYLAHYLDSPSFVVVAPDSLRRGYLMFSEARRASDEWPDTVVAGRPQLVWIAPGVVWAAFEYMGVLGLDTARGWSERLFVKTPGGWKIAVTGSLERCAY
jgi:hypothetical protein